MEKVVKEVFERWGYEVTKIPEGKEKRPDFIIKKGDEEYLVEVKDKNENPEQEKKRKEVLKQGGVANSIQGMARKSQRTKIVSQAKEQLKYDAGLENPFRLICITADGANAEIRLEQFINNLYGISSVCDWGSEESLLLNCYYFRDSDFYRYRNDLDGAILILVNSDGTVDAMMCLNNHSENYKLLKKTELATSFKDCEGLINPIEQEQSGDAYLVDSDVDRSNEEEVLNSLKEKYSLSDLTKNMDMNAISAEVLVRNQSD